MKNQKHTMKSVRIAASLLCVLLAVSCQREYFSFTEGSPVKFAVTSSGSAVSKTAYSGYIANGAERIDWQVGDTMRIYCAAVSEPEAKWADYIVTELAGESAEKSYAYINGTGGMGLRWGKTTDAHTFYAIYPSPAVKSGDNFPNGGIVSAVTCNIPTSQDTMCVTKAKTGEHEIFTAVPDMTSEYMVARKEISAGTQDVNSGDAVFLSFTPIVTAIEFTVINGSGSPMDIDNISLTSKAGDIAGQFTVDLKSWSGSDGYPVCASTGTQINKVTIPVRRELAVNDTLNLTFFLKPIDDGSTPVDIDDLTFRVTKAGGSWIQTFLGYTDGSGVVFPCHKKTLVQGLLVPEGAQWTVKYGPDVEKWNQSEKGIDPTPEVGGRTFVTSWDTEGGENDDIPLEEKIPDLLSGTFSVSASQYVQFSRGNLFCTDNTVSASPRYTFGFEQNQFDFRSRYGVDNDTAVINGVAGKTPSSTSGFFQWVTSNSVGGQKFPEDLACYGAFSELTMEGAKGEFNDELDYGGCMGAGSNWHSLKKSEMEYIVNTRANASYLRRWSTVCGVNGLLLAPDVETTLSAMPAYLKDYTTVGEWKSAASANGLVFLPAAGFLCLHSGEAEASDPEGVSQVGSNGYYYSSSSDSGGEFNCLSYYLEFSSSEEVHIDNFIRSYARSVRLVQKFFKSHESVNIGGVNWATMNVGATTVAGNPATSYGDYFAWGETEPYYSKITYSTSVTVNSWKTGKTYGYFWNSYCGPDGFTEWDPAPYNANNILKPEYDAARANWGGNWRMPTNDEFVALRNACTGGTGSDKSYLPDLNSSTPEGGVYWLSAIQTHLSDYTGVAGILFVDKNDTSKRVFFPAAGTIYQTGSNNGGVQGYYLSNLLGSSSPYADALHFNSTNNEVYPTSINSARCNGVPIRPVKDAN